MFWRVLRRSLFANRGRLFVILLALGAGAAITAALLNLQVDARQRITSEFRSFGANVLIEPRSENSTQDVALLNESVVPLIGASIPDSASVYGSAILFGIAMVQRRPSISVTAHATVIPVVVAGYGEHDLLNSGSFKTVEKAPEGKLLEDPWGQMASCIVGSVVAAKQNFHVLDVLELHNWNRNATADALGINRTTLYKKMKRLGLMDAPKHVRS
jgi:hypothetical protein